MEEKKLNAISIIASWFSAPHICTLRKSMEIRAIGYLMCLLVVLGSTSLEFKKNFNCENLYNKKKLHKALLWKQTKKSYT